MKTTRKSRGSIWLLGGILGLLISARWVFQDSPERRETSQKDAVATLRQFLYHLEKGQFDEALDLSHPGMVDSLLARKHEQSWNSTGMYRMAVKWNLNPKGPMAPIIRRWAHEERKSRIVLHPYDGTPSGLMANDISNRDAAECRILLVMDQRDDGSWFVKGYLSD